MPDLDRIPTIGGSQRGAYYYVDDMAETEVEVIKLLKFKLNYFTPLHFLEVYLNMGVVTEDEIETITKNNSAFGPEENIAHNTPGLITKKSKVDKNSNTKKKSKGSKAKKAPQLLSLDKLYNICFELLDISIESIN